MKLLFSLEDQVHTFKIQESLEARDAVVLKDSLFRFFETRPSYTILDLSHAQINIPDKDFQQLLSEIHTFATARDLNLTLALNTAEASRAKQAVLETALQKQVEILQAKLELREKMRAEAESLLAENANLKTSVSTHIEQLKTLKSGTHPLLSPLIEKLWSEK